MVELKNATKENQLKKFEVLRDFQMLNLIIIDI